jgi:hypothetical protein
VSSIDRRAPFVFRGSFTTCTTISCPGERRSRPPLGGLDTGQHDLIDVQEAVLLEANVDERRLEARQHVVDLALVDVADDRAIAAALYVELGDPIGLIGGFLAPRSPL